MLIVVEIIVVVIDKIEVKIVIVVVGVVVVTALVTRKNKLYIKATKDYWYKSTVHRMKPKCIFPFSL